MKFYRYNIVDGGIFDTKLVVEELELFKETLKGYWIGKRYNINDSQFDFLRWISKTSRKRYAYPTKEEALTSFMKRKEKQIRILKYQLESAQIGLILAKQLKP